MIISLLGYMGSGKSHIAKILSNELNCPLFDLDKQISLHYSKSIPEIFQDKGEIFFRKLEREVLEEILTQKKTGILSLGGGTPCYYNNMEIINQKSESVYLRANVSTLAERLYLQKEKRPLIANIPNEDLPEFIAKHLFDRNPFYQQAKYIIDTDKKSPEEIIQEISRVLTA